MDITTETLGSGSPEPPQPSTRRGSVWETRSTVVMAVVAVIGLLVTLGVLQPLRDDGEELVVVPTVTGLRGEAARAQLEQAGFDVEVRAVVNDQVPAGDVIATIPPGGSLLDAGSDVVAFVSIGRAAGGGNDNGTGGGGEAGEETVEIPDLALAAVAEARSLLEGLGLAVVAEARPDDGVDPGHVIASDPPAGAKVTPPVTVRLFVSTGPAAPRPDLQLFLEPACQVVGEGGVSGADVMTFFFRARSVGDEPYDGIVKVVAASDTGLAGEATTRVTDGPGSSSVQVELAPQDYDRRHLFTISVQAGEDIDEADKSNNATTIEVRLDRVARPARGDVVDPCSG